MSQMKAIVAFLLLIPLGAAGAAAADTVTGFYDFTGTQYADDFTDVRRGGQINADGADDVGRTGHPALSFTGQAGPSGDTWLTKWTPGGAPVFFNGRCGISIAASLLVHPFNNRKGAGLVVLLNDAHPDDKGLAVLLYDSGNSDALQLATIAPFTGKLTPLGTLPLGAAIREDAWYVLIMDVQVELGFDTDKLVGHIELISLVDPSDPDSDFGESLGVSFRTSLDATGLGDHGQVGIMASAIGARVDSSVTNWIAAEGIEGPCS
jgi:hypothetical protein